MEQQPKRSRAKKSLQVPLSPTEYKSISDEASRSNSSMPEVVRTRLRTGAEAEAEIENIIEKVIALENAGFILTVRALNGEPIDLKPLSLFILPASTRIPNRD